MRVPKALFHLSQFGYSEGYCSTFISSHISCIEAFSTQEEKRKEEKKKKEKKRGGRVTESALIQNVEGPASGNKTTAALSPMKLPPCNVVVFNSL